MATLPTVSASCRRGQGQSIEHRWKSLGHGLCGFQSALTTVLP
jgi:hypothetical protein